MKKKLEKAMMIISFTALAVTATVVALMWVIIVH